jgi:hypothetical protein
MKRMLMVLVAATVLPLSGMALAQDKPDCSAQKTAYDDAVKAGKVKADLSSCADKKGAEKKECVKPLKDKAKEDATAAKEKTKEAKKALDCCKNPKKKGCA